MKRIVIAIDGHSSTGKSTLAKALAKELAYAYIDTGAMYRAVSLFALRNDLIDEEIVKRDELIKLLPTIKIAFVLDEHGKSVVSLNGEVVEAQIRGMKVSNCVSKVSVIPQVRELLVAQQQIMGANKGIVMDGRDIGSVVFPDAELKLFMTASEDIRAQRRFAELIAKGDEVSFEEVKANISERDYRDTHRKIAPLVQTNDAVVLDNSTFTTEEQLKWVLEKVKLLTA